MNSELNCGTSGSSCTTRTRAAVGAEPKVGSALWPLLDSRLVIRYTNESPGTIWNGFEAQTERDVCHDDIFFDHWHKWPK